MSKCWILNGTCLRFYLVKYLFWNYLSIWGGVSSAWPQGSPRCSFRPATRTFKLEPDLWPLPALSQNLSQIWPNFIMRPLYTLGDFRGLGHLFCPLFDIYFYDLSDGSGLNFRWSAAGRCERGFLYFESLYALFLYLFKMRHIYAMKLCYFSWLSHTISLVCANDAWMDDSAWVCNKAAILIMRCYVFIS